MQLYFHAKLLKHHYVDTNIEARSVDVDRYKIIASTS